MSHDEHKAKYWLERTTGKLSVFAGNILYNSKIKNQVIYPAQSYAKCREIKHTDKYHWLPDKAGNFFSESNSDTSKYFWIRIKPQRYLISCRSKIVSNNLLDSLGPFSSTWSTLLSQEQVHASSPSSAVSIALTVFEWVRIRTWTTVVSKVTHSPTRQAEVSQPGFHGKLV